MPVQNTYCMVTKSQLYAINHQEVGYGIWGGQSMFIPRGQAGQGGCILGDPSQHLGSDAYDCKFLKLFEPQFLLLQKE